MVTDSQAREYERLNFTPHGEVWQEDSLDTLDKIDFLFTGKQMDAETGWYNFGKRYLDPKTGLWLSADPALGDYLPSAPLTDDDKKHNENLPGGGGVYNAVNFALYHFAGNNPIRYIDPDGKALFDLLFGTAVHRAIAQAYGAENPTHDIGGKSALGGFEAIGSIIKQISQGIIGKGDIKEDLLLRPDLVDRTTSEVWQIKSATPDEAAKAEPELKEELSIFAKWGMSMKPGSSVARGTSGLLFVGGRTVQYWSPKPGVILYQPVAGKSIGEQLQDVLQQVSDPNNSTSFKGPLPFLPPVPIIPVF